MGFVLDGEESGQSRIVRFYISFPTFVDLLTWI